MAATTNTSSAPWKPQHGFNMRTERLRRANWDVHPDYSLPAVPRWLGPCMTFWRSGFQQASPGGRWYWCGKGSRLLPFLQLQGVLHIPTPRFTCQLFLVRVSRPRFQWHNRLKSDRLRCDRKGWCEEVWNSVCANIY